MDYFKRGNMARRRKNSDFSPSRKYLEHAVKSFLQQGGKVKQLVLNNTVFEHTMNNTTADDYTAVEEFFNMHSSSTYATL